MTLNGLVLVGGQSSRMKQAKAHLCLSGKPQWQVAQEALRPWCEKVYFSVSPQLDRPIPVSKDELIPDIFVKPCGPLGGIISAFKKDPHAAWLVLACDMPYFGSEAAGVLVRQRAVQKLATVYENQAQKPEPLCAIYEPAIFRHLVEHWSMGTYCPRSILSGLDIQRLKPENYKILANINHAEEWEAMKEATEPGGTARISLHYYASLREAIGCSSELMVTSARTLSELFNQVAYKYKLSMSQTALRFAKNDQLVGPEETIADGDSIVLIPPVSGG